MHRICHYLSFPITMLNSSYAQWKAERDQKRGKPTTASSVRGPSSRVETSRQSAEHTQDGVYSFNQMKRVERERKGRPASEVGSIRSFQSVMTVEEQVNSLEKTVETIEERMGEQEKQLTQQNQLLMEILRRLPESASASKKS